jgi:predicted transcriptional regulator of viral defense system
MPTPADAPSVDAAETVEARPKVQPRPQDREIVELASTQHGVVTVGQVERLGLSGRALRHRVTSGRMRRVHRGVYAPWPLTRHGRWTAALLAVGEGALLSHRSAAALWDICDDDPSAVHVTVPRRAFRAPPGIAVHSGTSLRQHDASDRGGIPCTALASTLIDLAGQVDRRTLERAVDRAEMLRIFDLVAIERAINRARYRRGVGRLKEVLAAYVEPTLTRSDAEELMLAIAGRAAVPMPEVNAWVPLDAGRGYRPDFLWRDVRLIVEVDGRSYHARRGAFEHDRLRDRRLALAGYATHRFAASELVRHPRQVARELRGLLAVRRP